MWPMADNRDAPQHIGVVLLSSVVMLVTFGLSVVMLVAVVIWFSIV